MKVSLGSWPLREAPCDVQCRAAFLMPLLNPGSGLFSPRVKSWNERAEGEALSPDPSVLYAELESCHSVVPTDTLHRQGFLQGSSAYV